MKHRLTHEQAEAVEVFMSRQCMRTVAYAGAGKTSTLTAMANQAPNRRGLYVAFNKAIATEAGAKFPLSVNCRTAHSLAYRAIAQSGFPDDQMRSNLNTRSMQGARLQILTVPEVSQFVARQLVTGTIRRFCQSAAEQPMPVHVPRPRKPLEADVWREQRRAIVAAARQLWACMSDPENPTPLGHDGYLKLWQLSRPQLAADVIFVDEAQDLNPVLIDVISGQINATGAQVVSVGDSHQQIYAWRGAVDALEHLPGTVCRLTQSFRFGSNIAEFANQLLRTMGETVPLRGNGRTDDCVGPSDGLASAILCRTNSGVITNATFLMDLDSKIYIPGGVSELLSLVEDAERLIAGSPAQTADLLGFNTWREVIEHADSDDGADLKVFVNLVEEHGVRSLKRVLGQVITHPDPEAVTISTAHKSKGLEFDEVELYEDFQISGRDIDLEERRLFYVAATRAKRQLMVSDELARTFTRGT